MNVDKLLDRVCRRTGMQMSGTERDDVLDTLNDVYLNAITECRLIMDRVDVTLITGDDVYDIIGLIGEVPLGLAGVGLVSGDRVEMLEIVSHDELNEMQVNTAAGSGIAGMVAPFGTDKLMFWPSRNIDDVVRINFIPAVTPLVDAPVPIPSVPVQFHQSVLLAGTIGLTLDIDQRKSDVEFWLSRHAAGLHQMKLWALQFMGEDTRVFVSTAGRGVVAWPDERSRS